MKKVLTVRSIAAAVLGAILASFALSPSAARAAELVVVAEPDCAVCKVWERDVGAAYPQTDEGKIAPLRRVGLEKLTGTPYAFKQPVTATPTFVLMVGTMEVGRIIGYSGEAEFWRSLRALLTHADPEASPALRKADARERLPRAENAKAGAPERRLLAGLNGGPVSRGADAAQRRQDPQTDF